MVYFFEFINIFICLLVCFCRSLKFLLTPTVCPSWCVPSACELCPILKIVLFSLCNSTSVSIITGHQRSNCSSDSVVAKWFLSKRSVIFSNSWLCRRLFVLSERQPWVFFAKGREIMSASFSELTLINSGTLLLERWWKFGVKKTNNKQTSTVSLQMPWSPLLIKHHASSAYCLCHCYSNAFFIMLWMWRLCSAGSSTMSMASAPGPHAVCYSSWAVLRICMCLVCYFFTLHSMLHVPSPAKTCKNCKKDASAKLKCFNTLNAEESVRFG